MGKAKSDDTNDNKKSSKDKQTKELKDQSIYIRVTSVFKNRVEDHLERKGINNMSSWIISLMERDMEYGDILENQNKKIDEIYDFIQKFKKLTD